MQLDSSVYDLLPISRKLCRLEKIFQVADRSWEGLCCNAVALLSTQSLTSAILWDNWNQPGNHVWFHRFDLSIPVVTRCGRAVHVFLGLY